MRIVFSLLILTGMGLVCKIGPVISNYEGKSAWPVFFMMLLMAVVLNVRIEEKEVM